jgi:hypothetical protein
MCVYACRRNVCAKRRRVVIYRVRIGGNEAQALHTLTLSCRTASPEKRDSAAKTQNPVLARELLIVLARRTDIGGAVIKPGNIHAHPSCHSSREHDSFSRAAHDRLRHDSHDLLPAAIGLPILIYGLSTWSTSTSAVEVKKKRRPTARVSVLPVASLQKTNEFVGANLSIKY